MENNFDPSFNSGDSEDLEYIGGKDRFSSADKKGVLLIVLLFAVVLILAVSVKGAVSKKETDDTTAASVAVQTTATQQAAPAPETTFTTAPVTENTIGAVTTDPAENTTQTTANVETVPSSQTQSTEKTGYTDEEILKTVGDSINSLKSETACFKAHKTQVISITLLECSVPFLVDTINYVLDYFAGEKTADYDVTNGKATDAEGTEITVNHEIPPTDKPFTLTMEGVAEAHTEKTDKGTVFTVKVVPETSTLENPRPPHHNSACDTLDFSAFELPVGEITKCDFTYPGATVSVTLDENGKIVEYRERLEMSGTGEGGAFGISGSGTMEGYVDEVWSIEWK